MLKAKRIIYGITGSIAAIKAPIIARELMRRGADVHPAMTNSAEKFTTAYALSVLTQNETETSIFPSANVSVTSSNSTWHIHLGRSADAMLIAPCSATTLGKLRYGIYDNPVLLLAASLKEGTPLVIAPTMDEEMWLQPAVQENVAWLRSKGIGIIEPISGELASGLSGYGRMREPSEVVDLFEELLESKQSATHTPFPLPLQGKNILITAGPTYEPIDPVRFIGNRSSGKMGAAIADVAKNEFGANVTLIMGPSHIASSSLVNRIDVETTEEMRSAVMQQLAGHDIVIMSAAVSDYRIKNYSEQKLKKQIDGLEMHLDLETTSDILKEIAVNKKSSQHIIGFALESSERGEEYAKKKLITKSLDMIILNHYDEAGSGFSGDTNRITIFTKGGVKRELPTMTKAQCAKEILSLISELANV